MKKGNLLILFATLMILVVSLVIGGLNNNQINRRLTLEELRSLPYLTYTEEKADETKKGVVKYDPELAFDGYNLFSGSLMNMEGNIIHSWHPPIMFGVISKKGDVIAIWIEEYKTIGKYSWNSNTIWEKKKNITIHHEIALSLNDTILTLSREMHEYNGRKVDFDLIIELSQEGEEIPKWSTYENFDYIKKFHEPSKLDRPLQSYNEDEEKVYDYYHLNSIQVLPETPIGKNDKRFQEGNWLLSFRKVDLVAILDKETEEIVWSWGPGELERQHSPIMLDNGNILICDNGVFRGYTRIIELDPIKKEIVWEYKADPPESFFSRIQGYAQRLPNGNTLITESTNGRAFEITKEGKIVWEWFNPEINEEGKRHTIYRMVRYPEDKINKLLELYKNN